MKLKLKKKHMVILISIIAIIGIAIWFLARSLPYPQPKGQYKVGTVLVEIEDSTRNEWAVTDKDENRRFVVRVWYPAIPLGKEKMLPRMEKAFGEAMKKLYGFPVGAEKPSHSYINAPIVDEGEKFPVLIFTHGGGSFMTQNLTSFEELTSQGFIVMSISFPYESAATVFPDSSVVEMKGLDKFKNGMKLLSDDKEFISQFVAQTEAMKNPDPQLAKQASIDLGEKYNQLYPDMKIWLDTRIADVEYLINNLYKISINNKKLTNHADIENIGLFGHSFGGLTTLKFVMEKDMPAVKCGIALDVPYFNMDSASDISLKAPILLMSSEEIKLSGHKVKLEGINDYLQHYTNEQLHEVNVKGSAHYNFSDMNYLPKFMTYTPMLGSISQKEAVKIMEFYLDAYFKGHLKEGDLSKLEEDISPEAHFRKLKN